MDRDERITGGNKRKIQKRAAPRQSFTEARRQAFLDHLAGCANVTRSAAAAGVGVSTVYDARRREPAFAEQWADAMEAGYATLEALLIERAALGGSYVPGETPVPGPETVDTWLALDLLRLSKLAKAPRKAAGAPARRASEKQVAESICAKLEVLERRKARKTLRLRSGQAGKKRPSTRSASSGEPALGTNGDGAKKSGHSPGRRTPSPRPSPPGGEGDLPA